MKRIPEKLFDYFGKMKEIKKEIAKVIIGQEEAIDHILICLYAGGNLLLDSMPGLAKSLMVDTLAKILNVGYKRIQCTPDATPQDIVGYEMPVWGTCNFTTRKGPIFAALIMADEINRLTEKAQSGLMEAMQEKQVTIGTETFKLEDIFTLIGTKNPIETGGTSAMAEAVLDRFMTNVTLYYPSAEEEKKIAVSTEELSKIDLKKVCSSEDILPIRNYLRTKNFLDSDHPIVDYIVRLVKASRPEECELVLNPHDANQCKTFVKWSLASPRADKAFLRASLVYGCGILGEKTVCPEHVQALAKSFFRHRLVLNIGASQDGYTPDTITEWLLGKVPIYA